MICFFPRQSLRTVLISIIKKFQGKEIKKFEYVVDLGLGVSICLEVVSSLKKKNYSQQSRSRNRDFTI
jgi:hypothetical protein